MAQLDAQNDFTVGGDPYQKKRPGCATGAPYSAWGDETEFYSH